MKIEKINIRDFRGIHEGEFKFRPDLNVFVGVNGSGKSSILDAIVTSLSWLVNRIQRENVSGKPISESSIKNNTPYSSITITALEKRNKYEWKVVKFARGYDSNDKSEMKDVSNLASYFREKLKNDSTLPVFAYYPINRVVHAIEPKISERESLNTLDVYDNALGGKTNYQSFFEWFRLQDDIVNEKAQSRTKWMIQNKIWVRKKVLKLLSNLDKINDQEDPLKLLSDIRRFGGKHPIYEEPRYLFHELSDLLHSAEFSIRKNYKIGEVFHDIDYLLHRMGALSDSRKDNLIDVLKFPTPIIHRIVSQINDISKKKERSNENIAIVSFIWDALSLAVILSLWWLSDKGRREIENLFSEFSPFKLTRRNILLENSERFIHTLNETVKNDVERLDKATRSEGRELKIVTTAIEKFIPGYSNLRIHRLPRPRLLVDKGKETIDLDQLSDGEKNLIALVGDIARRLSIGNSSSRNPLNGEGIIFIDEIDLHLHPSWQRLMIPQLTKLFPNCQFFITTHSPQVLSHVKPEDIFLLNNEKGIFSYSSIAESYGRTSDRILEDIMGVDARPKEEKDLFHKLFKTIQDGNLQKAKKDAAALEKIIGRDPELITAEVLIKRKQSIGK